MDPETSKRHTGRVVGNYETREISENQMVKVPVCQIREFASFLTQTRKSLYFYGGEESSEFEISRLYSCGQCCNV